jgi:ribosomal protein S18 acetylase RimI-like enzyme
MAFQVVQIPKDDGSILQYNERVKAFRLHSLQTSPESFLSTYARESQFTDDVWYERLRNPQVATFIALRSDQIVSSIAVLGPLPYSPLDLSPHGNPWVSLTPGEAPKFSHYRINGMFTLPDARGQGIAKALLEAGRVFGAKEAAASGTEFVLTIAVDEDNAIARSLYQKAGFVAIKEEPTNRGDGRNVLLMQWLPNS